MSPRSRTRNLLLTLPVVALVLSLLLACTTIQTQVTSATPAWACPSPTPKPYGVDGPVKEMIAHPRPTDVPSGPIITDEELVYYVEWEQEYGAVASGPPFPSPTPYVLSGNVFTLGQRVRIAPLSALVNAQAEFTLEDGRQLYQVTISWLNQTIAPIAIDYTAQVQLLAVRHPNGSETAADGWHASPESLDLAGIEALPTAIPVGESAVRIPIIAPAGEPAAVALLVRRDSGYTPIYAPTSGTPVEVPQPTAATHPAPNTDLRRTDPDLVMIAFSAARPIDPPCDSPGATTAWKLPTSGGHGVPDVPIAAPPGADRLVELALAQVGKRYVWGAAGPQTFDCSGLVVWLYAQIGLHVPARTARDQFQILKPVDADQLLPGDLLYFHPAGSTRITHTAVYVGDINGDGVGDVVHAASVKYGVLLMTGGVHNPYYFGPTCTLCLAGYRTMR